MYQGGYQNPDYSGEHDATFQPLAQSLGGNIQKILQNVSKIQRMVTQIGTPQDTPELRNQLHRAIHSTGLGAKDTTEMLKSLNTMSQSFPGPEPRHRRLQRRSLQDDFSRALKSFQSVQRTVQHINKEASVPRARQESNLVELNNGNDTSQLMVKERQRFMEIKEREEMIRQLESDIVDVNKIFKDLACMVHDQGSLVDSIEENVEHSYTRISQGVDQLRQANQYKKKTRRKKALLFLILFIVVSIIVGIIVWLAY